MRFPGRFPRGGAPAGSDAAPEPTDRAPHPRPAGGFSVVLSASEALARAEAPSDVLGVVLAAAAELGAARPRAGLWRPDDAAYTMWFLDAGGVQTPCGSAPVAMYSNAPALDALIAPSPVVLLAVRDRRHGVLDVNGQITDPAALEMLLAVARSAAFRLDARTAGPVESPDEALLETLDGWWDATSADALLRLALTDTARFCGADSCAVTLLGAAGQAMRTVFSEDCAVGEDLSWRTGVSDRRNEEALRHVASTGEPLAFRWNPVTEALKAGLLPTGPAEGSYLAQPLTDTKRALGVLDVYSAEPRRFKAAEESRLAAAARALSRIIVQRERALYQEQFERRKDTIANVALRLGQQTELKPIAETLAGCAHAMWPDADLTYVMLPQVEGGLWSIAAMSNQRADGPAQGWARAGEGFAGWVIQSRQALLVNDADEDPRRGSLDRGYSVATGMWAPMLRGEAMLGLIAIVSQEPSRAFTPDDQEALEGLALQGAVALERARERLGTQSAFWDAIEAIAAAIDARDGYTHGHSRNVTEYALAIGQRLDLSPMEMYHLRAAALLHDIGKIGIPDHILNKPGSLTPDERTIMESHPEIGYEILLRAPSLQGLLPGVRYHHERLDGKGYPMGLGEGALPLQARIIAVADAFDAMTSDRVYRKRMTVEKAREILREGSGRQWDSDCVDAFDLLLTERATPRLQMLAAEDSGREYLPSLGADVFGA